MPATNIAKLAIQIEAQGGDQVIGHIGRVSTAAEGLSPKFAIASVHIGEATSRLAEMGTIGGRGITGLITGVSEFASAFGPTGLLISGVAAAAGAVIALFVKSREEMEKTRQAFDDEVGKMLDTGDRAGLMKKARDITQGTPSKNFQDSLTGLQKDLAQAKAEYASLNTNYLNAFSLSLKTALKKQIDDLEAEVKQKAAELKAIEDLVQRADTRTPLNQIAPITVTADDPDKRAEAELKAANQLFAQENAFRDAWVAAGQARMAEELSIEAGYIAQGKAMLNDALVQLGQTAAQEAAKSSQETIAEINDEVAKGTLAPLTKYMTDLQKLLQAGDTEGLARELGLDISSSIVDGFTAGFQGHGIADALESFGGSVLSGLGSIFIKMGGKILLFGQLMAKLYAALQANPLLGGFVAIAVGAALLALGSSLSSAASGGSSGGGGSFNIAGAGTASGATQMTIITLNADGSTPAPAPAPIPSPLPTPISKGAPAPIAVPSPAPIASLARTPIATAPAPLATVAPAPLASTAAAATAPAPQPSAHPRELASTPPAAPAPLAPLAPLAPQAPLPPPAPIAPLAPLAPLPPLAPLAPLAPVAPLAPLPPVPAPAPQISIAPRTINVTPPAPIVNIARAPITTLPASANRVPPAAINSIHQQPMPSVTRAPITNTRLRSTGAAAASQIKPLQPLSFGPFIGTNDGRAQRDIMELINAAIGRGYTFG